MGAFPPGGVSTLAMTENDIQQTARFTREFLVMNLIPWMEKCVVEWNENVLLLFALSTPTILTFCTSSRRPVDYHLGFSLLPVVYSAHLHPPLLRLTVLHPQLSHCPLVRFTIPQ